MRPILTAAVLLVLVLLATAGGASEPQTAAAANCGAGPCLRVDAIPGGGIDESASVGSAFSVDIVLQGASGGQKMGAFNFVLLYNASVLAAAPPVPIGLLGSFACSPPDPAGDLPEDHSAADHDPATGDAFLVCYTSSAASGFNNQVIARVDFTAVAAGSSQLRLINVSMGDTEGIPTMSCDPVISDVGGGGCTGASVSTGGGGGNPPPPPPPPPPPGDPNSCTVAYAADGETVVCTDGSRLRFIGVGSPLGNEPGAGWATALTNWFLAGKTVTLEFDTTPTDQFGQRFAYPHVLGTDGADYNISILLLYVGMARHFPDGVNNRHAEWMGSAQTWARAACWNMWGPPNPWTFESGCG